MQPNLYFQVSYHAFRQWRRLVVGSGRGMEQRRHRRRFSTSSATGEVTLVEVGPRDGLQNEAVQVPTEVKVMRLLLHLLAILQPLVVCDGSFICLRSIVLVKMSIQGSSCPTCKSAQKGGVPD